MNGILEAIQSISDEARRTLADPELPRDALLSALSVSSRLAIVNLSQTDNGPSHIRAS